VRRGSNRCLVSVFCLNGDRKLRQSESSTYCDHHNHNRFDHHDDQSTRADDYDDQSTRADDYDDQSTRADDYYDQATRADHHDNASLPVVVARMFAPTTHSVFGSPLIAVSSK
jgi:hypothetical protein